MYYCDDEWFAWKQTEIIQSFLRLCPPTAFWTLVDYKGYPTKVCLVKVLVFPVVVYGCESWTIKKGEHWRIDAFVLWCWRRLESPSDSKEIQPVHPKGIFIGRTDAEAETPILWPPDVKNWFIGKDADAGNNQRQEEKGMTEDEMVAWCHQLYEHEFK